MARPRKCRKVCSLPAVSKFAPLSDISETAEGKEREIDESNFVTLSVDEYETIRLIDNQNFTQEECSGFMNVARTTVQQIYNDARKKVALALVEGRPLKIEGGDYSLCDGSEDYCGCGGCSTHRYFREQRKIAAENDIPQ